MGNGTLTLSGSGNSVSGSLSVNAGTLNVTGGDTTFGGTSYIGHLIGSGALTMTGGSLTNSGEFRVGGSNLNGTNYNATGMVTLSNATLSVGSLTVARGNNPQNHVSGTVTLDSGSTLNSEGDCLLDFAGGVTAKLILNGGTLNEATTTKRWLIVSEWDAGSAEVDVNSGQVNINANTDIRFATQGNTGSNTFNLNDGAVTFYSDNATTIGGSGVVDLHQGNGSSVVNTFNLNGGTLTVSGILSANTSGTRTFNFNGGTLTANGDNSSFMNLGAGNAIANVRNGGAIIDDGGHSINIDQALMHSTIAGDNATDGGLTKLDVGTLTLSGTNTYTGDTTISNGTLALAGLGSISSPNIIVGSGATFDVSAITFTLGDSQALLGFGTVNGPVNASAGSKIYGGTDGAYGTNTFNNDLTLASDAAGYFDLGTVYNGTNDQIVVNGTLTANGNSIRIKAPSTSANLDSTADYVLISSANPINGAFATAPIWDVAPANAGHYTVVTSGNTVTLHYNATAVPVVSASANPATLLRNQPTVIAANVLPGGSPISTVTVDLSPLGGSMVSLVQSNTSSLYTNTVTVPATVNAGGVSLTVTATDTAANSGSAAVPLAINASTEVWNGAGSGNWSDNADWASGYAPGYVGDALLFAGSLGLTPNMDTNYSATGLTFSNNASSFTIGTANSSTLTLTANGIVNNSTSGQTIGVPVTLAAGAIINAASGDIALTNGLSTSSLNKTGAGTLTLGGANNYSGNASVSAGTVTYANGAVENAGGTLTVGTAGGSGTMNINSGSTVSFGTGTSYVGYQTGVGVLNINGGSLTNLGELRVGGSDAGGTGYNAHGTLVMTGGTVMLSTSSSGPNVGLTIARGNNSQNDCSGDVYINGGTFTCAGDVTLGFAGAGHAHLAINNGAVFNFATTVLKWFQIPQYDTTSGELDITNGILNINAGSPIRFSSGNDTTGINVINLEGGAINFYSDFATTLGGGGRVDMCAGSGGFVGTNIFNLDGGTITVPQIVCSLANGTEWFNFNGGTLKATGDNSAFMNLGAGNAVANVRNGGAIIDDGGFSIAIGQALVHSTFAGDNAVDGGLTKLGAGTLTLSGANSYNGNTTVKAGTLELLQATLAANSTVSITNGAMLKLDFAATNQVGALVLNGVSQSPGIYNSNTAPTYISGAGSLIIPTAGPGIFTSTPGITSFTLNGTDIVISGTNGEAGAAYYLLESTDVALPLSQWITVATNTVNANGAFTFTGTNVVTPGSQQQFYILSNTNSNH
jgi:autotransporter-associated beta strand protein